MERAAYDEMRAIEDHHWWFRGKRRVLAPLLRGAVEALAAEGVERPRVLDLGCGTGGNLAHLVEGARGLGGARALGVDLDRGALAYARGRGVAAGLVRGDGARLPFGDGSVHLVLALDVIEHFADDGAVVSEVARVLAPGGRLVASVPAHPSLWSAHDVALHHRRRYRRGELEAMLERAGLAIERRHGFNFLLLPAIALARRWRRRRGAFPAMPARGAETAPAEGATTDFFELPRPLNAAMAALFALESALLRVVPVPTGVSLMVRARRPR